MTSAVRFGVNYTPSQGWFHHWLDFDLDAVRADLDSIAALGLDHIRVFPLWPYFQPNRTLIRPRAVEQLVAARRRGRRTRARRRTWTVCRATCRASTSCPPGPGPGTGATSSPTRTWSTGQEAYLRTLAAALADRPNFIGMTIGNEVNQFAAGPHPDPDRITAGTGRELAAAGARRVRGGRAGADPSARLVRRRLVPGRPAVHPGALGPARRADRGALVGVQRHGAAPRPHRRRRPSTTPRT